MILTEENWEEYHKVCIELGQEDVSKKSYSEYQEEWDRLMSIGG